MADLEKKFEAELLSMYDRIFTAAHYPARRSKDKVRRWTEDGRGGVACAKDIIRTSHRGGTSPGLAKLAEYDALDKSLEALVLRPEYQSLFTAEELQICRDRLAEFDFTTY